MAKPDLPVLPFASRLAWEAWLEEHHASSPGLWLKLAKKESGVATVSYAEAIEGALCFGWIDGQKGALDARFWLQRFTPRQPKSRWSAINCAKVAELVAGGRMRAAGLRQVELAKQDGRWDAAYPGQRTMTVPPDLERLVDLFEGPVDLRLGAQVRAHCDGPARFAQAGRDGGRGVCAQVQDRDRRAGLRQRTRHHAAERAAAAGHDRDPAGKIKQRWKTGHVSAFARRAARRPDYRI